MTRQYELVYIFDSALEEAQINERLDRFHALLKSHESPNPVVSTNHWGKRTLAYAIKGRQVGYYVVAQFEADPELLGELERSIKLDEAVLRHLLVVNEGLAPVSAPAQQAAADHNGTDESEEEAE